MRGVPASPTHVSYGLLETDEEATPVGRIAQGLVGPSFVVWERPVRRKVFETWRGQDGQKYGRWTWEYL